MLNMSPITVSYSIRFGFNQPHFWPDFVSGCVIILVTCLPEGSWAIAADILIVVSLTSVGSLSLCFLWCILRSFNIGH